MYKILRFRGGVYKFDELAELVEDIGGMVLKKDCFEVIRGDYFLSTEVNVLLIVPEKDIEKIKLTAKEIMGQLDEIKVTDNQRNIFSSYILVYDALNRIGSWTGKEYLKELIKCPCYVMFCNKPGNGECQVDEKIEEILAEMCLTDIVEYREVDGGTQYRLKKEEE